MLGNDNDPKVGQKRRVPPEPGRNQPSRAAKVSRLSEDAWLRTAQAKVAKKLVSLIDKTAAGGLLVVEMLGPLSNKAGGTTANSTRSSRYGPKGRLPSGIRLAAIKYPRAHFKSGHLINQRFGGSGTNSRNLTILTQSANSAMIAPDNNIDKAINKLKQLYQIYYAAGYEPDRIETGIKLTVQVSGSWGKTPPDCYIGQLITYNVRVNGPTSYWVPGEKQAKVTRLVDEIKDLVRAASVTIKNPKPN